MTKKEAIERLIDMGSIIISKNEEDKRYCHAIKIAIKALEQPAPQWIPVSERLPKKSGQYYVSGGDKVWICEFLILQNFTGGWCNAVSNPVVQAWMPLPEPYRSERRTDVSK